jgi:hypothetical protein
MITAFPEGGDVHPDALVTVKVYVVPAVRPEIDPVVPVPVAVKPPGVEVIVQVPEAGKPVKATVAVARTQVGGVIVPIIGAD